MVSDGAEEQTTMLPSPRAKLKAKTKDDDWREAAFKRISISFNRINQQRDLPAILTPPIKSCLVWSPGLDEAGNSHLGRIAPEELTRRTGWSIFGA